MAAGGMNIIGRASASAVANISTNSLMNFDFSLVKLNAPAELMPLGECLSNKRREKAESGVIHILARRLGALFDGLVEETPNLLMAYGLRASNIAKSLSESSTKSARSKHGIFSNDAGIDGTTIWAAATSGPTALRLHLLACMLARLWSPQEATAIWVELVQERQRELRSESERNGFISSPAHAAAHIPIEELQLSEWDASARAWILSADKAMQLQQTQLMLIINNLSLNVDSDNEPVYKSVISVWRRGMLAMEKLVGGTGQSVESGAVLLGLSAWHLYPDMLVLGVKSVEIYQRDELVGQGGLLTVGLSTATSEAEGIHWSLPLASLRYYGGPAYTRRTTRRDSTRLSVPQLQLVAMGALLSHWNDSITAEDFSKFILILWKLLKAVEVSIEDNDSTGPSTRALNMLSKTLRVLGGLIHGANEFLAHAQDAVQRRLALQLLGYGKRHGKRWLDLSPAGETFIPHLFGLNDLRTIIPLLQPEVRVALLRDMIKKLRLPEHTRVLIRYRPLVELDEIKWEYALPTATPLSKTEKERIAIGTGHVKSVCTRFFANAPEVEYKMLSPDLIHQYQSRRKEECGEDFQFLPTFWGQFRSETWSLRQHVKFTSIILRLQLDNYQPDPVELFPEVPSPDTSPSVYTAVDGPPQVLPPESPVLVKVNLLFGHPNFAAVYSDAYALPDAYVIPQASLELDVHQICQAFEGALSEMDFSKSTHLLRLLFDLQHAFQFVILDTPLETLGALSELYTRYLPDATISMASTNMPLKEAKCFSELSRKSMNNKHYTLKRWEMFACILQMESGTINADPAALSSVFAISSGNSLFVAGGLLEDPHVQLPTDSVAHIVGNIGKAGIALLIPPNQQRIREVELGEWEVIVHAPFDGKKQMGLFDSTTMHLSPTGYELNYDTGTHGLRGRQAFFVETRIAVHDRGKWVADVDPLAAFALRPLQRYTPGEKPCSCIDKKAPPGGSSMISIDCWEELLDLPKENEVGVVRAAGSWMARLAAVAIAAEIGDSVVLPASEKADFCWSCFHSWKKSVHRSGSTKNLAPSSVPLKSVVLIW